MPASTQSFSTRAALAALAFAIAAAIVAPQAAAQSAIRVLVNDDPVTTFDVQNRARMLRLFSGGRAGEEQAVEQLIDEKLMLQEATRRGVTVSDEEVDAEFADRARQAGATPEQFRQAFGQAGVDPDTFRDFLRANMAWGEIVRARFRATVDVSDTEVAAALARKEPDAAEDEAQEEQTTAEYMLQQIVFVVPAKGGGGVEAKQRSAANAFKSAFTGCDNSLAQAANIQGVVVKPPVRREESQMSDALREKLATLDVGGITGPERVEEGFQLVAICAKHAIAGRTQATEKTRSELTSERGQMMARRYLRDLRSDAVIEYR
jgi:peptidyl-prolyl cis-trans isomerase SurA